MDTNNTMPPRTSGPAQPPSISSSNQSMDLYNAITKEDEEVVVVHKKKRQSSFMGLVVIYMKITFYFDSIRRSNESFFHFLGGIWAGFMGLIYLGGIVTLFLSIYSFMRMPLYLESYFESHNLRYDSLKMADYSLSRINVFNLHDEENKYVIPQLNVHSTFADFLQGRIRTVTVDGLQLNLKSSKSNGDSLENVLKVLGMIANPMESGLDLKINSVSINNAILNIEGEGTKIPVNFSMSGLYTNDAQVIIPFTVDEEFLKMDATLAIAGPAKNRKMDLTIKSGTLALTNRAPEDLQGTINIETDLDKITSLSSELNLNYGHNLKTIQTNLTNKEGGFSGDLSFLLKNTSEQEARPLADLSLSFEQLKISKDGFITTTSPLQMKINRLIRNATIMEGIEGTLNGELNCSLAQMECQYDLSQKATVRYQNLSTRYKEQNIFIDESGSLTFLPSSNALSLKLKDSKIGLNWQLSKVDLEGYYNTSTNPLRLKAESCHLAGNFSTQVNQDSFDVKVEDGFYESPILKMEGIQMTADDLYNPTAPIHFSSDKVTTSSPLLTQPISVEMTYLNRQVKANIQVKETDIRFTAEGIFQPFQKTFVGQFKMPVVELSNLPFALSELSPIFSKRINQPSGQVMASGQVHFAGSANIAGPLYVGLKNVNFHLDDTSIEQMDGVIALQSLLPLVSAANQNLFVGKVDTLVPLTNINASFQLENQAMRLLNVTADLGNEELSLSTALIPYRKPNALLYFKSNKDFDISKFASFLNLPGMTAVGGTASLAIPVDISERGVMVSSATLKVNNMTLRQDSDKKDAFGLFSQGNNAYMIRNGQLVYDRDKNLQLDLDGWLMPMRKREPFAQKDILLEEALFKTGKMLPVPQKIQDRQKLLFQTFMEATE